MYPPGYSAHLPDKVERDSDQIEGNCTVKVFMERGPHLATLDEHENYYSPAHDS